VVSADREPRLLAQHLERHHVRGPPCEGSPFPLYPLLVGAADVVLPQGPAVAALAIKVVLSVVAIALTGLLAYRMWGTHVAERSMILMTVFPGSFVLSFAYSEALLLALAVACLLCLHRQQWLAAGLLAALGTATPPNGLALAAACAVAAFFAIRDRREWRSLIAPVLAPLGVVAFQLFLWHHTGERSAWFRVQRVTWSEGASFGGSAIAGTIDFPLRPLSSPTDALTAISSPPLWCSWSPHGELACPGRPLPTAWPWCC
jgi:Gpi18-like mannosyltransferase